MNELVRYLRESGVLKTGSVAILVGAAAFAGLSIYKNLREIKLTDLRIKESERNLTMGA